MPAQEEAQYVILNLYSLLHNPFYTDPDSFTFWKDYEIENRGGGVTVDKCMWCVSFDDFSVDFSIFFVKESQKCWSDTQVTQALKTSQCVVWPDIMNIL